MNDAGLPDEPGAAPRPPQGSVPQYPPPPGTPAYPGTPGYPPGTPAYPPGTPAYPPGSARPTDGFAIAAFVLGLLGLILFGIGFGIVGLIRTKDGRRGGRGFAIAGIVLSVVWALVVTAIVVIVIASQPERGSGGEVTTGGRESFANVQVGDCLDGLDEGVEFGVDVVPCGQPHEGQVYAAYDLPAGPYPGEDQAFAQGEAGCLERVPSEWQDDPAAADLGTFLFVPQEANWDAGDREVICVATAGASSTGSLPGLGP